MSNDRSVQAFAYVSRELQGCFGHLAEALDAHLRGEDLPASLFSHTEDAARKVRKPRGGKDPTKPKRQPTAYNIFVGKQIEELKAEGFQSDEPRGLFKAAIDRWNALSQEAKDQVTTDFQAAKAAAEESGEDEETADLAEEADTPGPEPAAARTETAQKSKSKTNQPPQAAHSTQAPARAAAASQAAVSQGAASQGAATPAAATPGADAAAGEKKKKKKKRDKEKHPHGDETEGGEKKKKKKKRDKERPADGQSNK
ncbi:hypothetical protein WJX73_009851 [Symbiochloris irregularis]|uniref:HMG box domain-containing protein n=1 Tax=Symbiochloris irregularis TaxID=706552 RepID=A0AAW1NPE8_9CHLO